MKSNVELSDDLSRRIDRLAERTRLTPSQIVEDALSNGRSLAWQEKWVAGVQEGIHDADQGNFATDTEIADVLNKYSSSS
ncbi:ribbon-helix-helix protein, CopG family [Aliirhizobium terrae]|uniref:CopG family ribbon-helix-helix protein n=1 Tax=Terrirhizobium terrae TaxID=2926709 RepID=UPI002575472D|nr:ribbon-helix-helix protein, CopG family [Rhizobium sp. CC-CFT758]WJH40915.1 ribbon-helix-helix protein, CopG family [Rhizobium sp. CC-CFT758]